MSRKHGLKSQTEGLPGTPAPAAAAAGQASRAQETTCQLGTPGSSRGWIKCRKKATAIVNVKAGRLWKQVPGCDDCESAYYKRMGRGR